MFEGDGYIRRTGYVSNSVTCTAKELVDISYTTMMNNDPSTVQCHQVFYATRAVPLRDRQFEAVFRNIVDTLKPSFPFGGGVSAGVEIPKHGYTLSVSGGDRAYIEDHDGEYVLVFVRHRQERVATYCFKIGGFKTIAELNVVLATILTEF